MNTVNTNIVMQNKDITGVFVVTGAVLMVPWISMFFSGEMKWSLFDFILMGTLLIFTGLSIVLARRTIRNTNYRIAIIVGILALLALTWVELAVGIFGTPFAGN